MPQRAPSPRSEQVVPVRIVRSSPHPRPSPVAAPAVRRARMRMNDRRMLMWGGVIVLTAVIFMAWLGFVRDYMSNASTTDTLMSKLRAEFSDFFGRLQPIPKQPATNGGSNANQYVNENANGNVNANEAVNENANANLNDNDNANTNADAADNANRAANNTNANTNGGSNANVNANAS